VRTLAIQLPEEMLRRLDAYIGRVPAAHPSLRLSRTSVIRLLLDKGPRLAENPDPASDRRAEAGKPGPCQATGVME
jgi:hypothetical protein